MHANFISFETQIHVVFAMQSSPKMLNPVSMRPNNLQSQKCCEEYKLNLRLLVNNSPFELT
jgi:hypothetical protein